MEFAFILGIFTGSVITASFAAWCAWHEYRMNRTSKAPDPDDYVTPSSLLERHNDVSRFCEWGGIAGPGVHIMTDEPTTKRDH